MELVHTCLKAFIFTSFLSCKSTDKQSLREWVMGIEENKASVSWPRIALIGGQTAQVSPGKDVLPQLSATPGYLSCKELLWLSVHPLDKLHPATSWIRNIKARPRFAPKLPIGLAGLYGPQTSLLPNSAFPSPLLLPYYSDLS